MGVDRQARREQSPTGSCLALWDRKDVRGALWEARVAAATRRRRPEVAPAPRPVRLEHDRDYARYVVDLGAAQRHRNIASIARSPQSDPVTLAWVELVRSNLADRELVFFTGTYSDEYGISHGLMLSRNVQADFRRALRAADLGDRPFINAVEPHRLRAILHCHALVEASESEAAVLQSVWDKRGWSSAPRCHDGGVSYCCKYALKSSADAFDWRF